jgi:hypothetical protein
MRNDLNHDLREALAAFTDAPPPPGLAAAAIRIARRRDRVRLAVAGVAAVAAVAAVPAAVSVVTSPGDGSLRWPAQAGQMEPLVITAYSGHWEGSLLLDYATGEYLKLPYRDVVPSPDGTRAVVLTGDNSPADPLRIGVLDVATLEVRWIRGLYGSGGAAWSPDGQEILITEVGHAGPGEDSPSGFAIVDADTLEGTFVPHDDIANPEINTDGARYLWAPGGHGIALSQSTGADRASEADLTWGIRFYDRNGSLLRSLPTTGPVRTEAAFSPDDTRMAIFNPYAGGPIQIVDTGSGAVLRTASVPGLGGDAWGELVGWADDEHLLVRRASSLAAYRLYVIDLAGQVRQEVPLLTSHEHLHVGSSHGLTPEGARLTFGAP